MFTVSPVVSSAVAALSEPAFFEEEPGLFDGVPVVFWVGFGLVLAFIVAVFVLVAVSMVRNARRLRSAGIDPLAAQAEMMVGLHRSRFFARARSLEERLSEVDRLYAAGKISGEEHQRARSALLADAG